MKNVLIVGDSWGVPFYNDINPVSLRKAPNIKPKDHTQFQLEKLGYRVFNYSLNGAPNLETIEYARHSILNIPMPTTLTDATLRKRDTYGSDVELIPVPDYQSEKIDYIIWFYTEPLRTLCFLTNTQLQLKYITYKEILELSIKMDARAFINLHNSMPRAKTVIIGGQAPVHPLLFDYYTPDFLIKDWRSELVNEPLPECYSLSRSDLIDELGESTETKLAILDTHTKLIDVMIKSPFFYDNCHAGPEAHQQLAIRLHEWFLNN